MRPVFLTLRAACQLLLCPAEWQHTIQTQVMSPGLSTLADMSGRLAPVVALTRDDADSNSPMSEIPLQLPASANASSNNSALVAFSQAGSDLMQNVRRLRPMPNQTGANPWQLQYPVTYPRSVPAVLGPEESFQLVTQRAREALNDQRETARRALLHQQGEFLAAAHQREAVVRDHLENSFARNCEAQL